MLRYISSRQRNGHGVAGAAAGVRAAVQISKMLQQVATGKQFNSDAVHMSPLNDYISTAQVQFAKFFQDGTPSPTGCPPRRSRSLTRRWAAAGRMRGVGRIGDAAADVPTAEEHYQIDPLDDLAQTQKPVIYISSEELFAALGLLLESLDDVVRGSARAGCAVAGPRAWAR